VVWGFYFRCCLLFSCFGHALLSWLLVWLGVLVGLWWMFLGCLLGWGGFCVVTVIVFHSFCFLCFLYSWYKFVCGL